MPEPRDRRTTDVDLRVYVESILEEQRRGTMLAEREREKAAQALAITLARQIEQGDQALKDHIAQQVHQIREALLSAEKLEMQRFDALQEEVHLSNASSEKAISKAEAANERRFESVNEFRAQLSDQSAQYMPREVAETQIDEVRKIANMNTDRLNKMAGSDEGHALARVGVTMRAQVWIAGLGLVVAVLGLAIVVIVANVAGP